MVRRQFDESLDNDIGDDLAIRGGVGWALIYLIRPLVWLTLYREVDFIVKPR